MQRKVFDLMARVLQEIEVVGDVLRGFYGQLSETLSLTPRTELIILTFACDEIYSDDFAALY